MTDENFRGVILDSSALIAYIWEEAGAEKVRNKISIAVMSSINISEVAKHFVDKKNTDISDIKNILRQLIAKIVPFDDEQAFISADLIRVTKPYGLSLADRACLALSLATGYPVYTADKMWSKFDIPNIKIIQIR